MSHITQDAARAIFCEVTKAGKGFATTQELMNAAIQHYIDQQGGELPVLPDHPEPRTMKWSASEIDAIQAYGDARAAHALQSQAERITELESFRRLAVDHANVQSREALNYQKTIHDLRAQLAESISNHEACKSANSMLLDTIAEIEKAEPAGEVTDHHGFMGIHAHIYPVDGEAVQPPIGTKLFTRHMPTNRLTEMKLLMLTTAYEQGVGKGIQRRDCNPYAEDTDEHAAWDLGYKEGLDKPMHAQDVNSELVELLEFMWREVPMNDYAFEKLESALSKYKGAK